MANFSNNSDISKNPFLSEQVEHYFIDVITRETPLQRRLRAETAQMPQHQMQTTADQSAFLGMLVKLTGAKRIIECGTFTGYSSLAMALALPEDGKIICCDTSKEWTDIAKRYWQEAGIADKVELLLGPALSSLVELLKREEGCFDLAFIDADKQRYDGYYESCLKLVKTGGLIVFDNMLWGGAVADPTDQGASTKALRSLNAKIRDDDRVDACLLSIADGMMLARKR